MNPADKGFTLVGTTTLAAAHAASFIAISKYFDDNRQD